MYLLDTNVVSEFRRKRPHGAVLEWLSGVEDHKLHIAAIAIGELQTGIEITRERDAKRAAELEAWLDMIAASYNVVAMDAPIFRCWARLMRRRSQHLAQDAMIASTAIVRNFTVVTRNIRDFEGFDVRILNPFD